MLPCATAQCFFRAWVVLRAFGVGLLFRRRVLLSAGFWVWFVTVLHACADCLVFRPLEVCRGSLARPHPRNGRLN